MPTFYRSAFVLTALLALAHAQVPNSCTSWSQVDVGAEVATVVEDAVAFIPEYVMRGSSTHLPFIRINNRVGGLLSDLINILYPLTEAGKASRDLSDCAWQQILSEMKSEIRVAIDQVNLATLNKALGAEKELLVEYVQEVDVLGFVNASKDFKTLVFAPALNYDQYFLQAYTPESPATIFPYVLQGAAQVIGARQEMVRHRCATLFPSCTNRFLQYCNGSLYNADIDPNDRLRPCHLQALKATINNYADMIDNATQGYIAFAQRPERAYISDSENVQSNTDCGSGCLICSCGDIVIRGTYIFYIQLVLKMYTFPPQMRTTTMR